MMRQKIALLLTTVILLSGCGDEKSTGAKMADSFSKIIGDKKTSDAAIDKPIEKISPKQTAEENTTQTKTEEKPTISLKEIAHKAAQEIKETASPVLDTAKDASSIAAQSAKEVLEETKAATSASLSSAKSAIHKALSPNMDKAKETISTQVSKVKALLHPETNSSK